MILDYRIEVLRTSLYKSLINKNINKYFTDEEINIFKKKKSFYQHLIARLACKKALIKSLKFILHQKIIYTDISILKGKSGAPKLIINNHNLESLLKTFNIQISLSHIPEYCTAAVIIEKNTASI